MLSSLANSKVGTLPVEKSCDAIAVAKHRHVLGAQVCRCDAVYSAATSCSQCEGGAAFLQFNLKCWLAGG